MCVCGRVQVCAHVCVGVCACIFLQVSKQRDSSVKTASYLRCITMLTTGTCRDAHTHTHTPVQSAGAVVGCEGPVCTGSVQVRPPCRHSGRQGRRPCCTPASPLLSLGTNPGHKQEWVSAIPAGTSHQPCFLHGNQRFRGNGGILLVLFAFEQEPQSEDVECFSI